MLHFGLDMKEEGVAAAHDEGDVGLEPGKIGYWRVTLNPRRVKVGFVMMQPQEGAAQNEGRRLSGF
jgi:hypothetical protein